MVFLDAEEAGDAEILRNAKNRLLRGCEKIRAIAPFSRGSARVVQILQRATEP